MENILEILYDLPREKATARTRPLPRRRGSERKGWTGSPPP